MSNLGSSHNFVSLIHTFELGLKQLRLKPLVKFTYSFPTSQEIYTSPALPYNPLEFFAKQIN